MLLSLKIILRYQSVVEVNSLRKCYNHLKVIELNINISYSKKIYKVCIQHLNGQRTNYMNCFLKTQFLNH